MTAAPIDPYWRGHTAPLDVEALRLPDPDDVAHRDLYVRDGSRFVRVGSEPVPATPSPEDLPPGWTTDPECPARVLLPVDRCPHGHFQRWADRNCCATPTTLRVPSQRADEPTALPTTSQACTGRKTTGDPCGRRTTYRDRDDRPACHSHGGTAS